MQIILNELLETKQDLIYFFKLGGFFNGRSNYE